MTSPLPNDWPRRVSILGVGLLGGSVGLAVKKRLPHTEVVGFSRSAAKRTLAENCGAVDRTCDSIAATCEDADVVVVAATVDHIAPLAIEAAAATSADCLITDVGSTKATIVDAVSADPNAAAKFLAAHPIAGSEKTGVENATATLFEGKVIVLTPGERASEGLAAKAQRFWDLLGGQIVTLTPHDHDAHLAAVSHVPHLMSAVVSRLLPEQAKSLVGSGWRDITRVAAGDPTLWTAICRENREAIIEQLKRLSDDVHNLQQLLESQDDQALHQWLAAAKLQKESVREKF